MVPCFSFAAFVQAGRVAACRMRHHIDKCCSVHNKQGLLITFSSTIILLTNFYCIFKARGILRRARAVSHAWHKSVGTDRYLLLAHSMRPNGRGTSAHVR